MTIVALSSHGFWTIALIIGLVAALVVAGVTGDAVGER